MPPVIRYTREAVVTAAFELVRRDGLSAFNARSVAQELGSSTQPIFRLFSGMDELRATVIEMARSRINAYMQEALRNSDTPYLTVGLSYVLFARDESELFKLLFIYDAGFDLDQQMLPVPQELVALAQSETGFTDEQARILHSWLWIFTHGLAVSIATKSCCCFSEERLARILRGAYDAAALKLKQDIQNQLI